MFSHYNSANAQLRNCLYSSLSNAFLSFLKLPELFRLKLVSKAMQVRIEKSLSQGRHPDTHLIGYSYVSVYTIYTLYGQTT